MKPLLAALAILTLAASAIAGVVYPGPFQVVEDSASSTTWTIGNSPNDSTAGAAADFDTSSVYESGFWDAMTMQAKFRPAAIYYDTAGTADSGAAVVVVQVSNDGVYWTPVDSLAMTDSTAGFKAIDLSNWHLTRFIVHHGAGSDSAGVTGVIILAPHGQR